MKRLRVVSLCLLVGILVRFVVAAGSDKTHNISPDVVYGHKAGMALTFDVIRPTNSNGAAVLFMMSGGWFSGWVPPEGFMDPNAPEGFKHFRELVEHGYTLFIVRHGSAPQFKVPEAVADVRRAVRYVRLHANEFGIDPNRIGICGGSAGGHLSLMLGTASDDGDKSSQDEVDRTSDRVAAVVSYFPPVDMREWVGPSDRFPALEFDPKLAESISPLLHVSSDDPPTLLIHGDKDDLVKLDNSERILAAFSKKKVPCNLVVIEGAGHGFAGEQGTRASKALIEWFDKYLAAPAVAAVATGLVASQVATASDERSDSADSQGQSAANPQSNEKPSEHRNGPLVTNQSAGDAAPPANSLVPKPAKKAAAKNVAPSKPFQDSCCYKAKRRFSILRGISR